MWGLRTAAEYASRFRAASTEYDRIRFHFGHTAGGFAGNDAPPVLLDAKIAPVRHGGRRLCGHKQDLLFHVATAQDETGCLFCSSVA